MVADVITFRIDRDPPTFPKNLLKYGPKIDAAGVEFLYQEGHELLADSMPLVPFLTGALRSSGFVGLPERQFGSQWTVTIGYGDTTADYAIYVHEILEHEHPIGMAKFLEVPFTQREFGFRERYAMHIKKVIERGP